MADVLQLVLNGEVDVDNFILWFSRRISKENTPLPLSAHNNLLDSFAPFFLGYIREQSADALGINNSGLTPRKPQYDKTRESPPGGPPVASRTNPPASRKGLDYQQHDGDSVRTTPSSKSYASSRVSLDSTSPRPILGDVRNPAQQAGSGLARTSGETSGSRRSSTGSSNNENKTRKNMSQAAFIGGADTNRTPNRQTSYHRNRTSPSNPTQNSFKKSPAHRPPPSPDTPTIDLQDLEAFPEITVASKRIQGGRRIAPTLVTDRTKGQLASPHFQTLESPSETNSPFTVDTTPETTPRNLQQERRLLQAERAKCAVVNSANTPERPLPEFSNVVPTFKTNPVVVSDVTCEYQLTCLARIYSACLDDNLLQCLSIELHFLVQLLTVTERPAEPEVDGTYLSSAANCVHFAVQVLWLQRRLIAWLDPTLLKALRDNPRVKQFRSELYRFLVDEVNSRARIPIPTSLREANSAINIVAFQTDTDNRHNFVSDGQFNVFRKKRDAFCEILRDWQGHHHDPNSTKMAKLPDSICTLMTKNCDVFLYSHLARLFQAQLVVTCHKAGPAKPADDDPKLLELLNESNPERYQQLQERLVTPLQSSGPCPGPDFPGDQEFFKLFIDCAASSKFNRRLVDVINYKLSELTNVRLDLRDRNAQDGPDVDRQTREQFRSSIMTSRLLGKFLGYVAFAPYRTPDTVPDGVLASEAAIRELSMPTVDILTPLRLAVQTGRTVLVVPWLVEYLSMMDPVSLYIGYYRTILNILHGIYVELKTTSSPLMLNNLLLRSAIGWLFEIVNHPVPDVEPDSKDEMRAGNHQELDTLSLVDLEMLYGCCPYLGEVQKVLSRFANGRNVGGHLLRRKITPVSTRIRAPLTAARDLQAKMEEAFYHNQPESVQKTVDFIVKQLSSKIVIHVQRVLVTAAKGWGTEQVKGLRQGLALVNEVEQPEAYQKAKIAAYKRVGEVAVEVARNSKRDAKVYCDRICPVEATSVLQILLPEETSPSVIDLCKKLVVRACSAEVSQSLATQVDADTFCKDLVREMKKLLKMSPHGRLVEETEKTADCPFEIASVHDDDAPSPSHVMFLMKDFLKDMYENNGLATKDHSLNELLDSTKRCLKTRQDLNARGLDMLVRLSAEVLIAAMIVRPQLCDGTILSDFVTFWETYPALWSEVLTVIYSVRSLRYLDKNGDHPPSLFFGRFRDLALLFMQPRLQLGPMVDDLCHKLLNRNWPKDFCVRLDDCFRTLLPTKESNVLKSGCVEPLLPTVAQYLHRNQNELDRDNFYASTASCFEATD